MDPAEFETGKFNNCEWQLQQSVFRRDEKENYIQSTKRWLLAAKGPSFLITLFTLPLDYVILAEARQLLSTIIIYIHITQWWL